MKELSEEEFLLRLKGLDDETLYFISKYAAARRRYSSAQAWVAAFIAAAAGAALVVSYILPSASMPLVAAVSMLLGIGVAVGAFFQRRKSEMELVRVLLSRVDGFPSKTVPSEIRKQELIEEIVKSGGLP